jgi:o-succinylbenzoate---CoA ligase
VTTRLIALAAPPHRFAAALRTVWDAGDAVLPLPVDAPAMAVRALLASLRPHELRTVDTAGDVVTTPCADPLPCVDDLALVVATSGSTGASKGVELTHAALAASTSASVARLGCQAGEPWVLALPAHHVAGVQVVRRAWAAGIAPIVVDGGDVRAIAAAGTGREHVSLVPTQLARLIAAGVSLDGFRTILLGGAGAAPKLLAAARALGGRIVTSYGMTETSGGCVYDGVPLDTVEVAVTVGGRIRLRGPVLLRGYRGSADATTVRGHAGTGGPLVADGAAGPLDVRGTAGPLDVFRGSAGPLDPDGSAGPLDADGPAGPLDADGWFTTSDVGRWDGHRLEVLGRADDVVLSGGENVPAGAVAATLRAHPAVREAAVVGRPDPEWGEVAVAVVVPADPAAPPTLEALRAHVRTSHPPAHAPRALVLVPALPRDGMGKVPTATLRHLVAESGDGR